MKNLDWVLPWLVHALAEAPVGPPFLFAKLNIMDGFWRLVVSSKNAPNFVFVLPPLPDNNPIDPLIVIPLLIPMG